MSTPTPAKPFPIPVNYFGMTLGLFSLGFAWRSAQAVGLNVPNWMDHLILGLASVIWFSLLLVYVYKWLKVRPAALMELHHPILSGFVSLVPITTMLLGLTVLPYSYNAGASLILLGTLGQLSFLAYRTGGLLKGTHSDQAQTPVIYMPNLATNFVSAIGFAQLGYIEIAYLFFGMAMFSWIALEPAVLRRLRNLGPLEPALRPTLGIQLAPGFVAANTLIQMLHGAPSHWILIFAGYGALQFLLLMRLLPWILENGFNMGFWGFSFGLGSMASVGVYLQHSLGTAPGIALVGQAFFLIGNIGILILMIGTLYLIGRGKFLMK